MALDPVTAVLDIGGKLIDRLWPDPTEKAKAQLELFRLQQSGELQIISGQLDINKEEAKNASIFVSGWRPAVGWMCVAACGWNWIGMSIINTAAQFLAHPVVLKPADISEMLPILVGMLGIGGFRTIEKLNGKA